MKQFKRIIFKIIIFYLIIYLIIGSTCSVFASRGYDSACGEYLAKYSRDYVDKYVKTESSGNYNNIYDDSCVPCYWTGGGDGQGVWHVCCTTGVQLMYKQALGVELTELGWDPYCDTTMAAIANSSSTLNKNFDVFTNESDLQAGDILCKSGHNEMYVGNDEHFNSGSGHRYQSSESVVKIFTDTNSLTSSGGRFNYAIRLKSSVQVDPSGKVTGTGRQGKKIDYSNFFFNGIPDGKYSLASRDSLWDIIVEALKGMLDYFVGYLTYVIRIIIVGITSLFDKLLNNAVQSLNNAVPKSLIESGVTATVVQDDESEDRAVTIESLVFDQLELLDVNIFE